MKRKADGEANVGVDASPAPIKVPRRPKGPTDTARTTAGSAAGSTSGGAVVAASVATVAGGPLEPPADPADETGGVASTVAGQVRAPREVIPSVARAEPPPVPEKVTRPINEPSVHPVRKPSVAPRLVATDAQGLGSRRTAGNYRPHD